jgi:tetratricopeptide (TPR) repeat protein
MVFAMSPAKAEPEMNSLEFKLGLCRNKDGKTDAYTSQLYCEAVGEDDTLSNSDRLIALEVLLVRAASAGAAEKALIYVSRMIDIHAIEMVYRNNRARIILTNLKSRPDLLKVAKEDLDLALKANPVSGDTRANLYLYFRAKGDDASALEQLETQISTDPGYVRASLYRAQYRIEKGDRVGAIADMKAIKLYGRRDNVEVQTSLGDLAMNLNEFEIAQDALDNALRVNPTNARALRLREAVREKRAKPTAPR